MSEIIEKIFDTCFFILLLFTGVLLFFVFIFLFYEVSVNEYEYYTSECEHEWESVCRTRFGYVIYCPKCELKTDVNGSEWADILIEKKYGGNEK